MNDLTPEIDALIIEMTEAKKFNDDIFIEFFEKHGAMLERLEEQEKAGKLTSEQKSDLADRLNAAFEKLKSRLSFCNLH